MSPPTPNQPQLEQGGLGGEPTHQRGLEAARAGGPTEVGPPSAWKNLKGFVEEGRAGLSKGDKGGKDKGGKDKGGEGDKESVGGCVAENGKGVEARQTAVWRIFSSWRTVLSPSLPQRCAEGSEVPLQ